MLLLALVYLYMCSFGLLSAQYPACGGDDESATPTKMDSYVTRLMEMRDADGGWLNLPEAVLAVQLSDPISFTDKNKTERKMMEHIQNNIDNMSLGRLALYSKAVKSLCGDVTDVNGTDLTETLTTKLEAEFNADGTRLKSPLGGWFGFFLSLGALCVTSESAPADFYMHRALHAQNRDGSFGRDHSVDLTSNAMLSLMCLERAGRLSSSLASKIEVASRKASIFLLSRISSEKGDTWIGNKYSSPMAALALKEYAHWDDNLWRCNLVLKSLDSQPESKEPESAIAQRLMALDGTSFLALLDSSYRCNTEDTVTTVTTPRIDSVRPECSDLEQGGNLNLPLHYLTTIDVHIKVRPLVRPGQNSQPKSVIVRNVSKGQTLLEILMLAECRGLLTFETRTTSWGEYLTAIDSYEVDSERKEYWKILSNGESSSVGIGQLIPSHGDRISLRVETW